MKRREFIVESLYMLEEETAWITEDRKDTLDFETKKEKRIFEKSGGNPEEVVSSINALIDSIRARSKNDFSGLIDWYETIYQEKIKNDKDTNLFYKLVILGFIYDDIINMKREYKEYFDAQYGNVYKDLGAVYER